MVHKKLWFVLLAVVLMATMGCGASGLLSKQEAGTPKVLRAEATAAADVGVVTVVEMVAVEKEVMAPGEPAPPQQPVPPGHVL